VVPHPKRRGQLSKADISLFGVGLGIPGARMRVSDEYGGLDDRRCGSRRKQVEQRYVGIQVIPVEPIIGTLDRATVRHRRWLQHEHRRGVRRIECLDSSRVFGFVLSRERVISQSLAAQYRRRCR
jgi:hypothetical protein